MLQLELPKVAFVCTHNSCRSQIAEALGKSLGADVFESLSAGTEPKEHINPDAVRLMKEKCGIDMELTQHPKLIQELPRIDIVITMGCGVQCPVLTCGWREDWGLDDPTGKDDGEFTAVIQKIEENVRNLMQRIESGQITYKRSAD